MKYLFYCIILTTMCTSQNSKDSSFIKKYEEDSNKLINFFEKKVCLESENLDKCYKTFFEKKLQNMVEEGGYNLGFNEQNIGVLFSEISPKFCNEIWNNDSSSFFNKKGQYFRLLKKMAKENIHISRYVSSCSLMKYSIVTPTMQEIVAVNYDSFVMSDKEYRLFVAIHFISIFLEKQHYDTN